MLFVACSSKTYHFELQNLECMFKMMYTRAGKDAAWGHMISLLHQDKVQSHVCRGRQSQCGQALTIQKNSSKAYRVFFQLFCSFAIFQNKIWGKCSSNPCPAEAESHLQDQDISQGLDGEEESEALRCKISGGMGRTLRGSASVNFAPQASHSPHPRARPNTQHQQTHCFLKLTVVIEKRRSLKSILSMHSLTQSSDIYCVPAVS